MQDQTKVQHLMPLMREFGGLERQRLGAGVSPLEFQRWLDLKGQIGKTFAQSRADGLSATGGYNGRSRPTRLIVAYRSRNVLIDSIVPNIKPAGFFVPTPFAAGVGTNLIVRVSLDKEGESADIPVTVVTSITQGAHTLSTQSMGMSVKVLKPTRGQAAGISKIFASAFDAELTPVG
jgi:Tfp pilus assembly protein PilZ